MTHKYLRLPLKRLASITLGKMVQPAPRGENDVLAPYLRAAHIQPDGRILDLEPQPMWFSREELGSLQLLDEDVVVVEGGAGYGRSACISGDWTGWGFQNSIVRVRQNLGRSVGRFINYALQAALADGQILMACNTATFTHFTAEKVSAFQIPAPPVDLQLAIANFLDRETAEIDAFIADQEELIGLLAERRDGTWQAEVDSIGAPEVQLRRVIESIVDGPFGSSLTSAHYSEDGARVVRLGNIGINEFKDTDQAFIPMEYFAQLEPHVVNEGDVVIAGLGDEQMPLGRAAVLPNIGPAIVKADCYRVRPGPMVRSEYLAWILSAPQTRARMRELSRGSTRLRLNTAVVRNVMIPVPSLPIQRLTVERSQRLLTEMDAAITDAEEAIALSRERRAALISAAVTGKVDVREHGSAA